MIGKRILIGLLGLCACSMVLAQTSNNVSYQAPPSPFTPNVYVGAKVGYSVSGWNNYADSGKNIKISNASGFAAGLFAGWHFAKNFAVEAGWTPQLYTIKFRGKGIKNGSATSHGIAELMGKLLAPIPNVEGVDLYAKLGGAYQYTNHGVDGKRKSHFNVAYGAGATWEFMPSFVIDVGWTQYQGNNYPHSGSYLPVTNNFMVGMYYILPLA